MTPTPSAAAAHRIWVELTVSVKERDMDGVSWARERHWAAALSP